MTAKVFGIVIAVCVGAVVVCTAGGGLLGGYAAACAGPTAVGASAQHWRAVGGYSAEQVSSAATIVRAGVDAGVPARGRVVAVAVAIQESSLRNLHGGPDDSVGLFQQRPSQGWGTREQLLDPAYASRRFYAALLAVRGWQQMPLTEAGQAVQRSAYPDAYARWEPDAIMLVDAVGGPTAAAGLGRCPSDCPGLVSDAGTSGLSAAAGRCGWVAPVRARVVSGFRTTERPGHDGVDLGAARGTPIRAVSAGVVVAVRCDIAPAGHGCDQDGSPSTPGCGWYVDLRHAGNVHTRYCHMLTRPSVVEGQPVLSGQVIGVVGSSGHSSGPHLHFEVHLGGRNHTAVDPVAFMATRAPIGQP